MMLLVKCRISLRVFMKSKFHGVHVNKCILALAVSSINMLLLSGITNGIDITEWNPSSDEHIASHYSIDDLSGKVV